MSTSVVPGVTTDPVADRNVTVSLTTYGVRLRWTPYAIESIMEQTVRANRIVLWVDPSLASPSKWPVWLRRQCDRGLEVRATQDVGPATKLIPALKAFPDDIIITIDDDKVYSPQLVDRLLHLHKKHPASVCAGWVSEICIGSDGAPKIKDLNGGYLEEEVRFDTLAYGSEGVLYPSKCFPETVFDLGLMRRLSPTADDLWFKAMEYLNNISIVTSSGRLNLRDSACFNEFYPLDMALRVENVLHGGDNRQLKALFDHFNLYEKWPRGMK